MIKKKIREGLLDLINQRFVILLTKDETVKRVRNVKRLTTVLKSFIIQINIRQNFALLLLTRLENVNMEIIVLLLILNLKFQLSLLINFLKTQTSICSILKLCGALIMKLST